MFANYETKKIIYEKKPMKNQKPLFLLLDYMKTDDYDSQFVTASKCYCADCRKVFNIQTMNVKASKFDKDSFVVNGTGVTKEQDISCPECGNTGKYVFIRPHEKINDETGNKNNTGDRINNHINYEGSWHIPAFLKKRYIFAFRDNDKNLTRLDDSTVIEEAIIFPSGEISTWETELSQISDLINHRIMSCKMHITEKGRTSIETTKDLPNPFHYPDITKDFSIESRLNVRDARQAGELYSAETNLIAGYSHDEISETEKETAHIKSHAVFESLMSKLPHPVYADLVKNGLNLKEHKKGITEDDVEPDYVLQNIHYHMSVCYPAAIEYAAFRAENRAKNYEFSEKRKTIDNPDYIPKTATDNARAKFFREEMNIVANQLCACDDKILNEVRLAGIDAQTYVFIKNKNGKPDIKKVDHYVSPESDNPSAIQIMQERLSFFVYGLRNGYPVPNDIAIKLKDSKTLQSATQVTKELKSAFNMDLIATASNVYTLQKLKITDPNHVKSVLDLISQQSPDVNPADKRIQGRRIPQKKKYSPFINAGVMAPIRDKTALRFLRLYGQTHDTVSMISDIYDNTEDPIRADKWNQVIESIRLYKDIINNPNVALIQTKKDNQDKYDPVLNTTFKISTAMTKRQERIDKAIELYEGSKKHGSDLPAVPEDLQDFSVH